MSKQYILAIDAGTGSCRAILFDTAGKQIAVAQREWSHLPLPHYPGSQQFDTQVNWQFICACMREVLATPGVTPDAIVGVSSTSMREGIVLYDAEDHEIWACPNVDSRAGEEAAALVDQHLAEKIYFTGGDWVAITSPPRLLWLQKHEPEIFARVAHLTMLSDWILFKLCGEYATDPSAGSSSGMFDLARRTWSDEIVRMCGLDASVLPPVRRIWHVAWQSSSPGRYRNWPERRNAGGSWWGRYPVEPCRTRPANARAVYHCGWNLLAAYCWRGYLLD